MNGWLRTTRTRGCVSLERMPLLPYAQWYGTMCSLLADKACHCANCFAAETDGGLRLFAIVLNDSTGETYIGSAFYDPARGDVLPSLSAAYPAMHAFERDLAERYGVRYGDHPWLKPLRFPSLRADRSSTAANYPYYSVQGESLHEVNVGPIHAGIIEPGVFRFICNGEEIVHLEIVLGFQHRGIERLIGATGNRLRQTVLAESMAGDSVAAHTVAFCRLLESFGPAEMRAEAESGSLDDERALAVEMERMAVHLADVGALCMDIGYQLGQVACEALRTIVINSAQAWCGNRFAKGLVRPFGTHYPLTDELKATILKNISEVERRFDTVARNLENAPSVLSRFEDCGVVTTAQAQRIGAVGMAARASGLVRDLRSTHPWGPYADGLSHTPVVCAEGDVMARLRVRIGEIRQSAGYIRSLLDRIGSGAGGCAPRLSFPLAPGSLAFSLVEGWRGEICHAAVTAPSGAIAAFRAVDPSLHNWLALALAVRKAGISDFPINNKSFSLSYAGHDM